MQVETGCHVVVRNKVHDTNGNCIDDGTKSFAFTIGSSQTIPGIESAVLGRHAGECLQFTCSPEDAYGPHQPELVFEAVRANLPPEAELTPGAVLVPTGSEGRFQLKVVELTEKGAMLDGNHPLAGLTLHFDLEILEVSRP